MQEQTVEDSVLPAPGSKVANRRRAWREVKDRIAKYGVAIGGISVILAIVLIFFYLLYVVMPLFQGASLKTEATYHSDFKQPVFLSLNEYNTLAMACLLYTSPSPRD